MIVVRGEKLETSGMMTIVQVHHQQATRVCLSGIPRNINVVSSVSAPTLKISNRKLQLQGHSATVSKTLQGRFSGVNAGIVSTNLVSQDWNFLN